VSLYTCSVLHDDVATLRAERLKSGKSAVPNSFQGVTKARVKQVLDKLALGDKPNIVDAVFSLLDNETPSWFSSAPRGTKFSAGAATAHIGCHVGILQRGGSKLDREGRDYWIKPMRELGAIEAITLIDSVFVAGHPIANSGNSAYRLNSEFKAVLQASGQQLDKILKAWASQDAVRKRREYQAKVEEEARKQVGSGHSQLISDSVKHYAKRFLPGYEVLYIDDGDGSRITDEDKKKLASAGITLQLGDAMPDVLLWNEKTDRLWVIEAVTSDGEVDFHKVDQLRKWRSAAESSRLTLLQLIATGRTLRPDRRRTKIWPSIPTCGSGRTRGSSSSSARLNSSAYQFINPFLVIHRSPVPLGGPPEQP
jgi:hypothetical protein